MSVSYGGDSITFADGSTVASGWAGFKNRIINGAMVIDQRNAGASVTPASFSYTIDRWRAVQSTASKFSIQQNAGSVTPPVGFSNYLGATSLSAYSVTSSDAFAIYQPIEGFNFADMAWGTANAAAVTLSFWVRSSLTGSFGGVIKNGSGNRSYPFAYTISAANTWEQKSVSVAGDTTGTWVGATNGIGVNVSFGLGAGSSGSATAGVWANSDLWQPTGSVSVVGTNGATFYITGVQLEKGSTATSFDYRPYGTELALCQRYYQQYSHAPLRGVAGSSTTLSRGGMVLPVVMRSAPSVTITTAINWYDGSGTGNITSITSNYSTTTSCEFDSTLATGTTAQFRPLVIYNSSSGALNLSSEL